MSYKDNSNTKRVCNSFSKKQVDILNKASRKVWYYDTYFRMAIREDKLAGKFMNRKGSNNK